MDEKLIKNAEEAKIEKERLAPIIDKILEMISHNVNLGHIYYDGYMNGEVVIKLIELGFKVSRTTGRFNEEVTKIEWNGKEEGISRGRA